MWLLIDDQRELGCDVIIRRPEVAMTILRNKTFMNDVECVCLDHDLASEITGYEICKQACEEGLFPDHVQLVTDNPVGRENMARCLASHGYTSIDQCNWEK